MLAGAVASVGFMLHAGRRNDSYLLLFLFAFWVLSPFMGLVGVWAVSMRWSASIRTTLYVTMPAVALVSAAIYGDVALGPPRPRTAFLFIVVPPAAWLVSAVMVATAILVSRRREHT